MFLFDDGAANDDNGYEEEVFDKNCAEYFSTVEYYQPWEKAASRNDRRYQLNGAESR